MILTALVHLYEELCKQGKIQAEGWGVAKVTHRILLDKEGHLGKNKIFPCGRHSRRQRTRMAKSRRLRL